MTGKSQRPESDDNWEAQVRKGWLELAILATLWDGKHYGLEILRRLEHSSDLVVAEGTIYPILARLKKDGLIASEWVEAETGHPRKYYWLTPIGRRRSAAMAGFGLRFISRIGSLIEPLASEDKSK